MKLLPMLINKPPVAELTRPGIFELISQTRYTKALRQSYAFKSQALLPAGTCFGSQEIVRCGCVCVCRRRKGKGGEGGEGVIFESLSRLEYPLDEANTI